MLVSGIIFVAGISEKLKIQTYEIETDKVDSEVRIALITDLHSCYYGEGMSELLDELDRQNPDAVLLGGDIFDTWIPDENTETVLAYISGKYPSYYVVGNHEFWCGDEGFNKKMDILGKYEITRLRGDLEELTVNGETINICGIDDPDGAQYISDFGSTFEEQLNAVGNAEKNGKYTVLLSHRPERFSQYIQYDFDLVLCVHAHGGQWRVPVLVNGVYAPNQGFLPKYAGGEYNGNGTKMIVSRGLARETTRIPRVYNKPELVIIDLK